MNMQIKSAAFELKRAPDESGTFEGYASVFGVEDLGEDIVAPGAFKKSLASGRRVKMLWQHNMYEPIGVWDEVREDDRGLFVKGRLLTEVQKGREALALLKAGAIDGLSIGFRTIESSTEGRARKLDEVELHEISVVSNPMLPIATVTAVKNEAGRFDPKLLERALRDVCGLSISEAKAFMSEGFKAIKAPRDVGDPDADNEAQAILLQLRQLKEIFHV